MIIRLNLKTHCVQTEIKKLYNQAISKYFKPGSDKNELENKIEILLAALEKFDFSMLRQNFSDLAGHTDAEVFLLTNEDSHICLMINSEIISEKIQFNKIKEKI